jgi:hypothetical protein
MAHFKLKDSKPWVQPVLEVKTDDLSELVENKFNKSFETTPTSVSGPS